MNKSTLRSILATSLVAAGIGYTAGQLDITTDEVAKQAQLVKQRPVNDCQVAIVASAGKAQQVADFLDQKFAELDPNFDPAENGLKNLVHKVALASDPTGAVVAYATQFRLPSVHAEWLKTRADAVANVEIAAIEECASEQLHGSFDSLGEDGGTITEVRPYKSLAEFLSGQSPALVSWEDPNGPL